MDAKTEVEVQLTVNDEPRLAYDVPTTIANRFVVMVNNGNVRLAFGEAPPGEKIARRFHAAVLMSEADANALANLLVDTMRRHHERKQPTVQ